MNLLAPGSALALLFSCVAPLSAQLTPEQEPLVKLINGVIPAVVNISAGPGVGSGFFIDAAGHVVTNSHVIERARGQITVLTQDGQSLDAKIIGDDKEVDLALLKVEGKNPFTFIPVDKPSPNMLGQTLIVIGNPLGLRTSVTRGILSGRGRSSTVQGRDYDNLLQTDAAINPGNSGGPILDISGNLAGVSQLRRGGGAAGLSFAIPVQIVREKVQKFLGK